MDCPRPRPRTLGACVNISITDPRSYTSTDYVHKHTLRQARGQSHIMKKRPESKGHGIIVSDVNMNEYYMGS